VAREDVPRLRVLPTLMAKPQGGSRGDTQSGHCRWLMLAVSLAHTADVASPTYRGLRFGRRSCPQLLMQAASSSEPPASVWVGVPSSRSLATATREADQLYGEEQPARRPRGVRRPRREDCRQREHDRGQVLNRVSHAHRPTRDRHTRGRLQGRRRSRIVEPQHRTAFQIKTVGRCLPLHLSEPVADGPQCNVELFNLLVEIDIADCSATSDGPI
jgi:hypothetical protein